PCKGGLGGIVLGFQTSSQPETPTFPWQLNANMLALVSMVVAVCALSLASILIRLSEQELGPFATVFNRFWIAFVILYGGKKLNQLRRYLMGRWIAPISPTFSPISGTFAGTLADRARTEDRSSQAQATQGQLAQERSTQAPSCPSPLTEGHLAPEEPVYTRSDLALLILNGALFWGCIVLWAVSLLSTGVANSTILHNLTPIFTALGAWLLFNEQFDRRFLTGLALTVVGAIGLGLGDLEMSSAGLVGDLTALLSAVLSAANLMTIERLRSQYSATTIITWSCGVGAILSLPLVLTWEESLFPYSWGGWLAVVGLAFICQVLGQGLQTFSLKSLSPSMVGIILLLDPVLAALIAWALFAERLSLMNWLTFAMILLGIYLAKSSRQGQIHAEALEEGLEHESVTGSIDQRGPASPSLPLQS
ncbi:MAG: DMT family transporter, partial [Prochlorothrix sp.]